MTFYCDNISAINISKNLVQHSRTKYIDIRHHFIQSLVEDKVIEIKCVPKKNQLTDILTKGLDASRFETLRTSLGLLSSNGTDQHQGVYEQKNKKLINEVVFCLSYHYTLEDNRCSVHCTTNTFTFKIYPNTNTNTNMFSIL